MTINANNTRENLEKIDTRLLVLGGGPSGFSAAIYASRAELSPTLLTGTALGGKLPQRI